MPCLGTTLYRAGTILVVSFATGSFSLCADESDKKLTNSAPHATPTISSKPTSISLPVRNADRVQPLVSDLQRRGAPTFIENRGQFPEQVRFQLKSGGRTVWLTNGGVVLDLPSNHTPSMTRSTMAQPTQDPPHDRGARNVERLAVYQEFIAATSAPAINAKSPKPGIYNYLIGSDQSKWHTNVKGYAEVVYRNVWDGIDVRFCGNGPDLEQEFVISPGADLSRIQIAYKGIEALGLNADGSLRIQTSFGELRESPPKVYQEIAGQRVQVEARFRLTDERAYAFAIDHYRTEYALVIDPTLLYSTYLGGSTENSLGEYGQQYASGIAVDSAGNAYVTGPTSSTNFPTTPGAYSTSTTNGNNDFVTKFDPLGNNLVYSTYLTANGGTSSNAIALDASGDAYITGQVTQYPGDTSFPITAGAFQPGCASYQAQGCAFLTVLNSTGSGLVYSTYFGGGTVGSGIAVDASGLAYLTGSWSSFTNTLPTTPSAVQANSSGAPDAFAAIINPSASGASSLVYSTYLGGSASDYGNAITVDSFGSMYVTGSTTSADFPVTQGAYQTTLPTNRCGNGQYGTCPSAFIAKINPSVSGPSGLIYATYLSGSYGSTGAGIAVDGLGNAYVAGKTGTLSSNPPPFVPFPSTQGALLACADSIQLDSYAFVTKLNTAGNTLIYSTCLGPFSAAAGVQNATGVGLDANGDAYVTGSTRSATFPVTTDAFQSTWYGGGSGEDGFITKLNSNGSGLIYSSLLGGPGGDTYPNAIAVDATGDAYITGGTSSTFFYTSPGVFQPTMQGPNDVAQDAFVTKFPLGSKFRVLQILPASGGNSGNVTATIVGSGFQAGASAKLFGGQPDIVASSVTIGPGALYLTATFNLQGAAIGAVDVVVTNADGTVLTLPQAFTIQQGGNVNAQVDTIQVTKLGSKVVPGRDATYYITISNTGSNDSGSLQGAELVQPWFTYLYSNPVPTTIVKDNSLWPPAVVGTGAQYDQFLEWDIENVPPGGSQTLSYTVALDPTYPVGSPVSGNFCAEPGQQFAFCSALTAACIGDQATECLPFIENPAGYAACLFALAFTQCWDSYDECAGAISGACSLYQVDTVSSFDPNSLTGPSGVGSALWVSGLQPLTYVLSFSNDATAQVPAQQVVVRNPLGLNVDMSTLSLTGLNVPGVQVPIPPTFVPAAGSDKVRTTVDLRPTQNLLVNIEATLNPTTGLVTWTFSSIDPATGLPPVDSSVGFLPPGAAASLSFTVKPEQGVATGTRIADQAAVVFDANSPVKTLVWVNTIDDTPPVSQVSALSATSTCPVFRVSWSGSDVGSGLKGFTIFVSDTGGPFTPWISNTSATSADYRGAVGHTYSFYSIATDRTGNVEAAKTMAEASTSVTASGPCGPPSLAGRITSVSQSGTTVTAALKLTNTGFTRAHAVNLNAITLQTLSGSGTVTLSSPTLPAAEGPLGIGASTTVTLTLDVPTTVTQFSITERGKLKDSAGDSYSFSLSQTVTP